MTEEQSDQSAKIAKIVRSRCVWTVILATLGGVGAIIAWSFWFDPVPSSSSAATQSGGATAATVTNDLSQAAHCSSSLTPTQYTNCISRVSQQAESNASQQLGPHSGTSSVHGTIGIALGISLIGVGVLLVVTYLLLKRRRDLRLGLTVGLFSLAAGLILDAAAGLISAGQSYASWNHASLPSASNSLGGVVTAVVGSAKAAIFEHSVAPAFGGLLAGIMVVIAAILSLQARTELLPMRVASSLPTSAPLSVGAPERVYRQTINPPRFCGSCGSAITEPSRFCGTCGEDLTGQ